MSELEIAKLLLEILAAGGTAFVTITGGILAIKGFNAWRREYFGKKAYEFAEETAAELELKVKNAKDFIWRLFAKKQDAGQIRQEDLNKYGRQLDVAKRELELIKVKTKTLLGENRDEQLDEFLKLFQGIYIPIADALNPDYKNSERLQAHLSTATTMPDQYGPLVEFKKKAEEIISEYITDADDFRRGRGRARKLR